MTAAAGMALARREFIRFIRQPQRVIGSVGQPLLFWLFLGAGFTASFQPPGLEGMTYLEYFYPGILLMMILFAGIFSNITVIEDRDQGFLQGVLVAPTPRAAIVLGKVCGGTLIAMVQAVLFLMAAPFLGLTVTPAGLVLILAALVMAGIGFTSLGFVIAWSMRSTAGFHAIMMVFLFPLWMLSGALFPPTGAPAWLQVLMTVNPVSHALTLIRSPFYESPGVLFTDARYLVAIAVTAAWVTLGLWVSIRRVNRRERGLA